MRMCTPNGDILSGDLGLILSQSHICKERFWLKYAPGLTIMYDIRSKSLGFRLRTESNVIRAWQIQRFRLHK